MRLLPILGKSLKDDDVTDLLDALEMEVIYDFDRSHEGLPDKYWATSQKAGIQLRFNEAQILDTIFLYIAPQEGFAGFAHGDSDVPVFRTAVEVQEFGDAKRLHVSKGQVDFLGVGRDWIRLGFETYSIHYEFRGCNLAQITVSRVKQ